MKANSPIGIFDSGIGGLTVARAVKASMPEERFIYFGDTAHLPYGDKSESAIQSYAIRITEMLLQKECKVILIACNSASSVAYDLVQQRAGDQAKVIDVINPTVDLLRQEYSNCKVGLIGTKRTVESGVYNNKVRELARHIDLVTLATPLLVPMIEEGLVGESISHEIIQKYLSDSSFSGIKALILGCTHYPIIQSEIEKYYANLNQDTKVIDSAETVAEALKSYLSKYNLRAERVTEQDQFLVSDFTPTFERTTKLFFGEEVHLERLPIWDELN